jgi:signal transduction histidine kinase
MPAAWRSIRFRLSVQYSAIVFGLGGALLGLVYLALRRYLRSQTMTQYVWTGRPVFQNGVQIGVVPSLESHEIRMIESVYNEIVLNEVAKFTIFALIALFLLSLIVGWVMSGRVLRPVERITNVAREIQASDLSRRIGLTGPDDEITRLASTFDGMLERLDRAFASQRRFLADTSHDLRTPLAVIRSNVEVVADDPSSGLEDWRQTGAIVRRNVEKMSEMIDDLLAAARLDAGKAQAMTLDLSNLVEAKRVELGKLAEQKGVELVTRTTAAVVEGVEVSLDRALTNLVDNAIKASPPGSRVEIGSGTEGEWAWLAVGDRGPGLPAEPDGGRIGLGLSIVEQIARAHGGALVPFTGDDRFGTTMVIWLPTPGTESSHPSVCPFTVD